jgi:N-acyl homoserine lactone hydrolase
VADLAVRRVDFGYFVRPPAETGTGAPQVEPCLGYLIDHPAGLVLVDTGMGSHPDVDAHYRPRRRSLHAALANTGVHVDDITYLVNCHLHFDHCGGNPTLPDRPIFTQRVELETARHTLNYTLPELIDAPGLRYEQLDGETEILPHVVVTPTPGHTSGHQIPDRPPAGRYRHRCRPKPRHRNRVQPRRAGLAGTPRPTHRTPAAHTSLDRPPPTTRPSPRRLRPRQRRMGANAPTYMIRLRSTAALVEEQ